VIEKAAPELLQNMKMNSRNQVRILKVSSNKLHNHRYYKTMYLDLQGKEILFKFIATEIYSDMSLSMQHQGKHKNTKWKPVVITLIPIGAPNAPGGSGSKLRPSIGPSSLSGSPNSCSTESIISCAARVSCTGASGGSISCCGS
jgi:hypothetical protein